MAKLPQTNSTDQEQTLRLPTPKRETERRRERRRRRRISQIGEMQLEDPYAKQRLHVTGAAPSVTGNTPQMKASRFPHFFSLRLVLFKMDLVLARQLSLLFWIWPSCGEKAKIGKKKKRNIKIAKR